MISILVAASIRSLAVAAIVGALLAAFRVRDAGLRHRAWTLVLVATLLMPVLHSALPALELPLLPTPPSSESSVAISSGQPLSYSPPPALPVGRVAIIVYLIVAAALLVRHGIGYALGLRLVRSAHPIDDAGLDPSNSRTRIMASPSVAIPVTFGWLHPAILLPDAFRQWTRARLAAVIAHESAHIDRRDFAVGTLASVTRALFWFHPLTWWLEWRMSSLAEQAADDRAAGPSPDGYAEHLVEFARALGPGRLEGLSFARRRGLTARIERLLNPRYKDMKKPNRYAVVAILSLAAVVTLGAATVALTESTVTATTTEEASLALQESQAGLSDEEQNAYQALTTDEERIRFLEQALGRREALLNRSAAENQLIEEYEARLREYELRSEQTLREFEVLRAREEASQNAQRRDIDLRGAQEALEAQRIELALEADRRELALEKAQLEAAFQRGLISVAQFERGDISLARVEAELELEAERMELALRRAQLEAAQRGDIPIARVEADIAREIQEREIEATRTAALLALEAQQREIEVTRTEALIALEIQQRELEAARVEGEVALEIRQRELERHRAELEAAQRSLELELERSRALEAETERRRALETGQSQEEQAEETEHEGPFEAGGDVTPPRVLEKVDPELTAEAREAGAEGTVIVEGIVRTDGSVEIVGVVRGAGYGLDEVAIEALRQWRFEPGTRNGEPVDVRINFEINFTLRD